MAAPLSVLGLHAFLAALALCIASLSGVEALITRPKPPLSAAALAKLAKSRLQASPSARASDDVIGQLMPESASESVDEDRSVGKAATPPPDLCLVGFHLEQHADPQLGDVCRSDDKSDDWYPPKGCSSVEEKPYSVTMGSDLPCRTELWWNYHGLLNEINMERAKTCARECQWTKHVDHACKGFMIESCRPGKDLEMDGGKREHGTHKGYCKEYFDCINKHNNEGEEEDAPAHKSAHDHHEERDAHAHRRYAKLDGGSSGYSQSPRRRTYSAPPPPPPPPPAPPPPPPPSHGSYGGGSHGASTGAGGGASGSPHAANAGNGGGGASGSSHAANAGNGGGINGLSPGTYSGSVHEGESGKYVVHVGSQNLDDNRKVTIVVHGQSAGQSGKPCDDDKTPKLSPGPAPMLAPGPFPGPMMQRQEDDAVERAVQEEGDELRHKHRHENQTVVGKERTFATLAECEEAIQQCSCPTGGYGGNPGGLVHDERGGRVRYSPGYNPADGANGKAYMPPESHTGRPSAEAGWDYSSAGEDWGDRFPMCKGPDQSPIDLPRYVDTQGQTKFLLWFDYYRDPELSENKVARLENDGHALRYLVRPNGLDMGFVKIYNKEYRAVEYTFHAPSEHSMDGAVFPLELQIYNQDRDGDAGNVVAISILFREGPSNPFLAAIQNSVGANPPIWSSSTGTRYGSLKGSFPDAFNLEHLIPPGDAAWEKPFFTYRGSLTEPPCSTGVDWWVLAVPITGTRSEIRFIRRAIFKSRSMRHGNARAAMPIGNRTIFVGLTGYQHAVKDQGHKPWRNLDEVKQPRGYNSGDVPWGPHWQEAWPKETQQ